MWIVPAASLRLSHPLILSASGGLILPFGKTDRVPFPLTVPGLRVDAEAGIGGGMTSAGVYIPLGDCCGINLKSARMRTWLVSWDDNKDRTYRGIVAEFVIGGHVPAMAGIGRFEDQAVPGNRFTYFFVGAGW